MQHIRDVSEFQQAIDTIEPITNLDDVFSTLLNLGWYNGNMDANTKHAIHLAYLETRVHIHINNIFCMIALAGGKPIHLRTGMCDDERILRVEIRTGDPFPFHIFPVATPALVARYDRSYRTWMVSKFLTLLSSLSPSLYNGVTVQVVTTHSHGQVIPPLHFEDEMLFNGAWSSIVPRGIVATQSLRDFMFARHGEFFPSPRQPATIDDERVVPFELNFRPLFRLS